MHSVRTTPSKCSKKSAQFREDPAFWLAPPNPTMYLCGWPPKGVSHWSSLPSWLGHAVLVGIRLAQPPGGFLGGAIFTGLIFACDGHVAGVAIPRIH
jgi:hypothetical protein